MSINIDKALNRSFIIKTLEDYELHTLWEQKSRTVLDVPGHYEQVVSGGIEVVNDGVKSTMIEVASVTPLVAGATKVVGQTVAVTPAYNIDLSGSITVVEDGTVVDPTTEIEISVISAAKLVDGYTPTSGDTVSLVNAYENVLGGLQIVADGYLDTIIEISDVTPTLSGYTVTVGDLVSFVDDTYKDVNINVHKYGKVGPWQTAKKYFIGDVCTYDNCLYEAIADVDGTDADFPEDKFQMVGADSLLQIRQDKLDAPAKVKQDCVYWLKENEVSDADPSIVIHKAGIYTFTKSTGTYELYREYEDEDIEFLSFFETVEPADLGYVGDDDKVVSSKYLHTALKNVTEVIQEEITDLENVLDNANYYILENKAALDAYDLTTLTDNTMNIFLVKQDDTKNEETVIVDKEQTVDKYSDGTTEISNIEYNVKVEEYNIDQAATTPIGIVDPSTVYTVSGTETTKIYNYEEIANPGNIITQAQYNVLVAQYNYDVTTSAGTPVDPATLYTAVTEKESQTVDVYPYAIPGTDPVQYESTLYACVAYDDDEYPKKERTVEFVGKLAWGQESSEALIREFIRKALYVYINSGDTYYTAALSTDTGALEVVADSTQTITSTQIKISNVIMKYGDSTSVGSYVIAQSATENMATNVPIYVKRTEIPVSVLQYVGDQVTKYTDEEGVEADVYVTRLTYQNKELMPYEFEEKAVDFSDPDDYTPIVEGEVVS